MFTINQTCFYLIRYSFTNFLIITLASNVHNDLENDRLIDDDIDDSINPPSPFLSNP